MKKKAETKGKRRLRSIGAKEMKKLVAGTLRTIRGIEPETARTKLFCRRLYRVDRILFASEIGLSWHECRENMIRLLEKKIPKEHLRQVPRLLKLKGRDPSGLPCIISGLAFIQGISCGAAVLITPA